MRNSGSAANVNDGMSGRPLPSFETTGAMAQLAHVKAYTTMESELLPRHACVNAYMTEVGWIAVLTVQESYMYSACIKQAFSRAHCLCYLTQLSMAAV